VLNTDIEHAATNDNRTGSFKHAFCYGMIDLRKFRCPETKPMMKPVPRIAKWTIDGYASSGDIPIE
jgi:hypothetical protein